ncbi:MAG: rRNA methyltransferase [Holophagaceae bacterium]|nr:rRNA methyltransferase [Holophagaceae bacterium]
MNLLLLLDTDFISPNHVRLSGRRLEHVRDIHRLQVGDSLKVGMLGGYSGNGEIHRLDGEYLELNVTLDCPPPPKLPLTLILALPRPKVLNRVLASATSLGVARIFLVNAWKVEKSYWKSPRLEEGNLLHQRILGLEQARDTMLPELQTRRLLRPFVEDELPGLIRDTLPLMAHPGSGIPCPRAVEGPVTLTIGPEGGFLPQEVELFGRAGFQAVELGPRILRVETAVAALVSRLY